MTFPYSGGNLTDPWDDNVLVNAADMLLNITDPLNALADAVVAKSARVMCVFNTLAKVIPSGAITFLPINAIVSEVGADFSVVSGTVDGTTTSVLQLPDNGVYLLRLTGSWTYPSGETDRTFVEATNQSGAANVMFRASQSYYEDVVSGTGFCLVTGSGNNKVLLRAYQLRSTPVDHILGALVGTVIKISE